jgi:toxin ParE1/3/4
MALTYRLHSLAKTELMDAVDWYEDERKGRGAKFFIAYLKTLKKILANPLTFSKNFNAVRKANIPKFPYSIYYETYGNEVLIYAVFHHKRSPESWKIRIGMIK